jgi:hypothetical protein
MRLGQLSRKLGLKPSDIQAFLGGTGLEAGPNARLTDDQVLQAVRHFDPSREATIFTEPTAPEPVEEPAAVAVAPEQHTEPLLELPMEEVAPQSREAEPELPLEIAPEVIRAPKLELPGLRVVGKIELKDPKKKESSEQPAGETPAGAESSPARPAERPDRPARPIRRERPQRTWSNPMEQQRQREADERRAKREEEIQREKDRRTQKYLKKVKSAPTKPVRRQEETVVETQVETKPVPKTWLGKFARWLTT